MNESLVETPAGTVYIDTIKIENEIKVRARLVHTHNLTIHMPIHSKDVDRVVKEAEGKAIRMLVAGALVPRALIEITRELNVLLMECIINSHDSVHLEDIKIRRMDLCDRLAKLQEMARGKYNHGDARPADDQG